MKYIRYVFLCIYISCIIIIFTQAATSGKKSSSNSNKVTDIVIDVIDGIAPSDTSVAEKYNIDQIRVFVRKVFGHFGIFLVLGVFATLVYLLFIEKLQIAIPILLVSGCLIAIISEVIQIFATDRGPSIKDVLIDCCGYFSACIIVTSIIIIINLIRNKKQERKNIYGKM